MAGLFVVNLAVFKESIRSSKVHPLVVNAAGAGYRPLGVLSRQGKAFLNNPTQSLQLSRVTMLPIPALEGGVDGDEEVVYPERAQRRDGERSEDGAPMGES